MFWPWRRRRLWWVWGPAWLPLRRCRWWHRTASWDCPSCWRSAQSCCPGRWWCSGKRIRGVRRLKDKVSPFKLYMGGLSPRCPGWSSSWATSGRTLSCPRSEQTELESVGRRPRPRTLTYSAETRARLCPHSAAPHLWGHMTKQWRTRNQQSCSRLMFRLTILLHSRSFLLFWSWFTVCCFPLRAATLVTRRLEQTDRRLDRQGIGQEVAQSSITWSVVRLSLGKTIDAWRWTSWHHQFVPEV